MLRITELKLPLDHTDEALREAIVQRLGISDDQLLDFTLFKRSYDARKKNTELLFIYTIDVNVRDEAALLHTFADDRNIHVHDGVAEAEFVAMRMKRDATLVAPVLLLPSVQVNIRAGRLPPPDDNGQSYLKIPVKLVEA